MIRIRGRNSVIPPGCDGACARIAKSAGTIMPNVTIILPFPPWWAILPRPAGYESRVPKKLPRPLPHPTPSCGCLPEACLKVRAETFELPKLDSLTNSAHDVKVKVEIVVGVQDDREKFSRRVEVPQVRAGISATNRAGAGLVNRPRIIGVFRVANQQSPLRSVQAAVARAACGKHAVHHIHAERYVIEYLLGFADTHQIARTFRGKARGRCLRHFARDRVRLADCKAADRVARKIQVHERVGMGAAQRHMSAALDDAKKHLPRGIAMACKIVAGATRPIECARGRLSRARFLGRRLDALIEYHGDIRAQGNLNLEGFFRRKKMLRSIEVGAKCDAVVSHFAETAQAEYLEAARIGKNRARPGHEFVQAAHPANQFVPGTQIKMVRIREDDLRVEFFEIALRLALYGCGRAYRHKRGRFDHTVRRGQTSETRAGRIGRKNLETKTHPWKCIRR